MVNRLTQRNPAFAARLTALPIHRQAEIAVGLAQQAVSECAVLIASRDESMLSAQVDELDDVAWKLHEAGEDQYEVAFTRARAANALLFALHGDATEAVYEALTALGNLDAAWTIIGAS